MSNLVTAAVMKHCKLKGERRTLMLCLAFHADDTGVCWPSQRLLAMETNCTERGIRKMIAALSKDGQITVVSRGVGRGNMAQYSLAQFLTKEEHKGPVLKPEEKRNVAARKEEPTDTKEERGDVKAERPQRKTSLNNNRTPKNNKNIKVEVIFPSPLDCEEFKTAWNEWLLYRSQRKPKLPPYTEIGIKKQFTKLAKMGLADAIEAIDNSIAQNYQGIFPARRFENGNGHHSHRAPIDYTEGF